MIGYTPSHLTENEVILEKLNQIIEYLIKNPSYQVYVYNGGFISGTLTYEIANIINSNNINVADVVVFNNGYYGIISEITETEFTLTAGISLIGPQGPQGVKGDTGPQGPKGDTGTIPEALPQEASAVKSGNLPTSGWGVNASLWTGSVIVPFASNPGSGYPGERLGNIGNSWATSQEQLEELPDGWQATIDGKLYTNIASRLDPENAGRGIQFFVSTKKVYVDIRTNGDIYVYYQDGGGGTITQIGCSRLSKQTYTISDTSITVNSDILMELTDEGGVKAYAMEAGKMTVIRDTVPTQPIPYTYKVKQTNASGQFTLVNHYVPTIPVTSVNGQTGAVTIAVPTKTSQLENDSGYVSNLPIVQNVVCNDVDSATTLDTTITCEVGDLILAQIIVRSALTLPTGWTLLRTIPAVETSSNQTLSFAYKKATSTSETLTVTQATAARIYTNLVRLSNAASISYIQSCEKTGTGIKSISSTKPVTSNMVIWGASSITWNNPSPYGDWTYSPSTLDYYSLPQASRQPRLGTFIDSSGAGERTFTGALSNGNGNAMMCGAVEIVGDEVARKGDIPSAGEWKTWSDTSVLTEEGLYEIVTTEYPSDGNKTLFVSYEQGKPNNGACWVSVATANSISVVTPICSGDGTLRVERRLANSSDPADLLTFKYRKIN